MIGVGIAFVVAGLATAAIALWKVNRLPADGPAQSAGPYIYPFVTGCEIALIGGFVLVGQLLLGRLLA